MKKILCFFVLFISLILTAYSQEKNVTVSGQVVLSNVNDYSGVTITFNRTAPSTMQYSLETDSTGSFQIEIKEGIYNISLSKKSYQDTALFDVNLFDDKDLGTITMTYLGVFLKGEISGVLKSGLYEVRDTIFVPSNKSLTIEKGTTLKFHKDAYFLVDGDFDAEGTENERIVFTSFNPDEYWCGVNFIQEYQSDLTPTVTIKYMIVEKTKGNQMYSGLNFELNKVFIDNIIYQNNNSSMVLFWNDSNSKLSNSTIINNKSSDAGLMISSCMLIENCLIANNENIYENDNFNHYFSDLSGGIRVNCVSPEYPFIKNTIIRNNTSNYTGGIAISSGTRLINCVIVNNKAKWSGSGICYMNYYGDSTTEVFNTVIANNTCENYDIDKHFGYQITCDSTNKKLNLRNCLFFGSDDFYWSFPPPYFGKYVRTNFNNDSTDAYGNIFKDPEFVDEANGNFRLAPGSPAIDAGLNVNELPEQDYDGKVRIWDGNNDNFAIVDIGAFEYNAPDYLMIKPILSDDCEMGNGDFIIPDANTFKRTNEDAHSGSYSLMLDNSNGDNGNSWILSNKFKTASNKKYYLSFWIKLAGGQFTNEDKLSIHFCIDNGDISSGNYKIKSINNFEKLWQKVMIEVEGEPSDNAQFGISTAINSKLKLFIDDIKIETDALTSVNDPIKKSELLEVYPNPSSGAVTIAILKEFMNPPFNFEIFNSEGRMLKSIVTSDIVTRIEELNSGAYYLRFQNKDYTIIKKFTVVK